MWHLSGMRILRIFRSFVIISGLSLSSDWRIRKKPSLPLIFVLFLFFPFSYYRSSLPSSILSFTLSLPTSNLFPLVLLLLYSIFLHPSSLHTPTPPSPFFIYSSFPPSYLPTPSPLPPLSPSLILPSSYRLPLSALRTSNPSSPFFIHFSFYPSYLPIPPSIPPPLLPSAYLPPISSLHTPIPSAFIFSFPSYFHALSLLLLSFLIRLSLQCPYAHNWLFRF